MKMMFASIFLIANLISMIFAHQLFTWSFIIWFYVIEIAVYVLGFILIVIVGGLTK